MKKVFAICLAIISIINIIAPVSATELILLGDTNQDGVVSVRDAILILRHIAGIQELPEECFVYADVNCDKIISIQDAHETLKLAASISAEKTLSFSDWEITVEPTCTSYGEAVSISLNGLYTRTKILPKKDHDIVAATCTQGAHCSKCFKYTSDVIEHNITDATCTTGKHCSMCDNTFSPALGHDYVDGDCVTPVYCRRCNHILYEAPGHNIVEATCTNKAYCITCNAVLSETFGHNIVNGVCVTCGFDETNFQKIFTSKGNIRFGDSTETLISIWGNPTEILNDTTTSYSIEYYVYAEDYLALTIFTCTDDLGVIGVYSIDPEFKIMLSETVSYDNANQFYFHDDVYFDSYIDSLGTGKTYAIYATTIKETTRIYPNTNFRSCEKLLYHMVNGCRAINGVPIVGYSDPVAAVALLHSQDMANNNYFNHQNLEGKSAYNRLTDAGVKCNGCSENIAAGQNMSPYDFNNSWYNSSGHRTVMLNKRYDEVGIGVSYNETSAYDFYATENYIVLP